MIRKDIKDHYSRFRKELEARRINRAVATLKNLAASVGAPWQITADIDAVSESYNYLCRYAIEGVQDPCRKEMLDDIVARLAAIGYAVERNCQIADSPRQYFNVARYESLQPDGTISELLTRYAERYSNYSSDLLFGKNADDKKTELDKLAVRVFNVVWTKFPLDSDEQAKLETAFADEGLPEYFKGLLISALTLGCLEYFDYRRMIILAKIYLKSTPRLEIRALVGLVLNLWHYNNVSVNAHVRKAMESVFEKDGWCDDLKMVFLELVRTRDTERISRKLNEEVIPEMIKMRPDILNRMGNDPSVDDLGSIEENPEWAELIEQSGIGDKIKELNELQADGGDVMMSAFGHLKGFPFFNDVANWFMPFSLQHSAIKGILDDTATDIGELIDSSEMMCDSDKYSIILSLDRIPSANRRMMLSQFKLQDINISEIKSSSLNPEMLSRKNLCNKYIQDLYRFFKLYRRKSDFYNPFESPINLSAVKMLSDHIEDSDALVAVGEFYFKRGFYSDAHDIFEIIIRRDGSQDPGILQKCGYCCQKIGHYDQAIEYYTRAEFLRPDSEWTLRRLAQCYKAAGDTENALKYYLKVLEKKPDDLKIVMSVGNCYLELGRYADALKYFYKIEFLSKSPSKAYRPIAWTLLLTGEYDKSLNYYKKVIEDTPTWQDYLNAGHLRMVMGQYQDAMISYRLALKLKDVANIESSISADRHVLESAGVDPVMIDIIIDTLNE